jgi:hypothetical protein
LFRNSLVPSNGTLRLRAGWPNLGFGDTRYGTPLCRVGYSPHRGCGDAHRELRTACEISVLSVVQTISDMLLPRGRRSERGSVAAAIERCEGFWPGEGEARSRIRRPLRAGAWPRSAGVGGEAQRNGEDDAELNLAAGLLMGNEACTSEQADGLLRQATVDDEQTIWRSPSASSANTAAAVRLVPPGRGRSG